VAVFDRIFRYTDTSNTVRNAIFGFSLGSTGAKAEPNTIAQTSDAIDFLCDSNNTVKSNRIDDASVALANVPSGTFQPTPNPTCPQSKPLAQTTRQHRRRSRHGDPQCPIHRNAQDCFYSGRLQADRRTSRRLLSRKSEIDVQLPRSVRVTKEADASRGQQFRRLPIQNGFTRTRNLRDCRKNGNEPADFVCRNQS
jgi:hypothetical protein